MNNNFENLAKLALNEATIGDYLRAVKTNVGNAFKPSPLAAGIFKAADSLARSSGMSYNGQFGNIARGITNLVTHAEKMALEKFERPKGNPKKNDKVIVNLPFIYTPINSIFGNAQAVTGGTSYSIALPAVLDVDSISIIDKQGYQTQIFYYKNKKQLFKPETKGKAWPVYVGLHYNQQTNSWVIDTDTRKIIPDLDKKKQFIANYKNWSSPLDPAIKTDIIKAADWDEIIKILDAKTEYGKMKDSEKNKFMNDLTNAYYSMHP